MSRKLESNVLFFKSTKRSKSPETKSVLFFETVEMKRYAKIFLVIEIYVIFFFQWKSVLSFFLRFRPSLYRIS